MAKKILSVKMLGGFEMFYEGKPIAFERHSSAKFIQLLQILLLNMENGASKEMLIDALYGRDMVENGNSSLNNTIFRLRRQLAALGLPKDEYITVQNGRCIWNQHIPAETDTQQFQELLSRAEAETERTARIERYKEACALYRGELLPMMAGEEWAAVANVQYRDLYFKALRRLLPALQEEEEYRTMLEVSSRAAAIYPFEEWQIWRIDSLIGMKQYKQAMDVYVEVEKYLFDEYGVSPSEKMLERFRFVSGHIEMKTGMMRDIKEQLSEKDAAEGGYFCYLPGFIDIYHLSSRLAGRNGQSTYLVLCTLTDRHGRPLEKKEKADEAAGRFSYAVCKALRKGDVYTRYNKGQFLLILSGTSRENCVIVFDRIEQNYRQAGGKGKISYHVSPIVGKK